MASAGNEVWNEIAKIGDRGRGSEIFVEQGTPVSSHNGILCLSRGSVYDDSIQLGRLLILYIYGSQCFRVYSVDERTLSHI